MNAITINNSNGELTVSSLQVSNDFGKQHKDVVRAIENLKAQNCALTKMFVESTYKAGTGKNYKSYEITRDGFSLLVMGFTGKKALEWKLKYIEAFNLMEQKLKGTKSKYKQLEMYNYFEKKYRGEPVLSSMDVSYFTNINYSVIDWYARTHLVKGTDYYILTGDELRSYKLENPEVSRLSSSVVIFNKKGFDKICKAYGITVETPKLFINKENVLPVKKNSGNERVEMDDYITALRVLRSVRKDWLNILEKNKIDAFDTCVHYVCLVASANSI